MLQQRVSCQYILWCPTFINVADEHGANWEVSAGDLVQAHLSLALSKYGPDWPGATNDQLYEVAQAIVTALEDAASWCPCL